MKRIIYLSLVGVLAIACKPDGEAPASNNAVSDFQEMEISESFDWSTTQQVSLSLIKVPNAPDKPGVLTVKDVEGKVLIKQMVSMNEDAMLSFNAASHLKSIEVSFGLTTKTVTLSNGQGSFDFLPILDDSDLD
jgi:hypothetical protein